LRYLPLSNKDRQDMLERIGVSDVKDLFIDAPEGLFGKNFDLPDNKSEQEVISYLSNIAKKNQPANDSAFFLGAGCYRHFIPATVDHLVQRAEFLTSYTPYQPEISQGTLAVIFEYQSMICSLTGMDVSNASLYDGATSLVEAVLMAKRVNKKKKNIVVANELNSQYLDVLQTYLQEETIHKSCDTDDICAIIVQTPDYYGTPHNLTKYKEICDKKGALLIVVNTEIISFGLLPAPKEADIVVGEAQSLGVAMNFGGPHLGYFACKEKYVRQMPGRICGLTKDEEGKDGFVLTLNAREQHIRRQKATSNICSNQGLNMVAFTIHLALLGRNGLKRLAKLNHHLANILKETLANNEKIKVINKSFFNEFVIELPIKADLFLEKMLQKNIMAGVKVADNRVLIAVTEMNSQIDIENYNKAIDEIL
jgi:glycine dehydrogenase subunit 1